MWELALADIPRGRPPVERRVGYNVALGKLVFARAHTFYAPAHGGDAQVGLQRLTDGKFAGGTGIVSRQTVVLAPYTADLPELPLASLPDAERETMPTATGYMEVDLGGVYRVGELLLEADARGDYRLEGSREGRFWQSLCTMPAAFGQQGFVTRTGRPSSGPVDLRYVRVSGAAGYGVGNRPETFPGEARRVVFAVSELQVFTSQARPRPNTILPGMERP
jgi:hypothetical protein